MYIYIYIYTHICMGCWAQRSTPAPPPDKKKRACPDSGAAQRWALAGREFRESGG